MLVALLTAKLAAAVVPNFTALAPVKSVPVIATEVVPVVGPEARADAGHGGQRGCRCTGRLRSWRSCRRES